MGFLIAELDPLDPGLISQVAETTGPAGVIIVLIVAVIAFMRGWVRRGTDADEWRDVAQASQDALAKLVPIVDSIASTLEATNATIEDIKRAGDIEAEITRRRADDDAGTTRRRRKVTSETP